MKKLILALFALTFVYAVSAQEVVTLKDKSTGTYSAYSIPEPILVKYTEVYGDPAIATWSPLPGWWMATYKGGVENRITHVYYTTEPWYLVDVPDDRMASYKVSLPVINSFVPEAVIKEAISKHGDNLYSIRRLKAADNSATYQVTLIKDGTSSTELLTSTEIEVTSTQ